MYFTIDKNRLSQLQFHGDFKMKTSETPNRTSSLQPVLQTLGCFNPDLGQPLG